LLAESFSLLAENFNIITENDFLNSVIGGFQLHYGKLFEIEPITWFSVSLRKVPEWSRKFSVSLRKICDENDQSAMPKMKTNSDVRT
jgi:hypothetical protein